MKKHLTVPAILLCMAITAIACSSPVADTPTPAPTSARLAVLVKHSEYGGYIAAVCGGSGGEPSTWADAAQGSRDRLERALAATPPPELAEYHESVIAVRRMYASETKGRADEDPDGDYDWEFVFDLPRESRQVLARHSQVVLPPGASETLRAARC